MFLGGHWTWTRNRIIIIWKIGMERTWRWEHEKGETKSQSLEKKLETKRGIYVEMSSKDK